MAEFWDNSFREKQEMWGLKPSNSALIAADFFKKKSVKNILIPGIGYGRNAQVFMDTCVSVRGIEISETAIKLANKRFGETLKIYHGSVLEMPFDNSLYDGVFCYALIHLFNKKERRKLIEGCYNQLIQGGYMIFTMITKKASTYGKGRCISKDRYKMFGGVKMFFYDEESVYEEFSNVGLSDIVIVEENYPFYLVLCQKDN